MTASVREETQPDDCVPICDKAQQDIIIATACSEEKYYIWAS